MGIVVKVRISGAREMIAAFRVLGKEANGELRDANQKISEVLAGKIASAARGSDGQSALVAPTVKAMRDRLPTVQAGGRRRAGRQSRRSKGQKPTTASDLLFGSNFGATMLKQFRAHTGGGDDYWFFRTVEANEATMAEEWTDAADRVLKRWGS